MEKKPAITQKTPLKVVREVLINGRKYPPGALFPWRKAAICWRRCCQLYEMGKLVVLADAEQIEAEATVQEDISTDAAQVEAKSAPKGHKKRKRR